MKISPLSTVVAKLESGKRPKGGLENSAASGKVIPSLGGEHLTKSGDFNFTKLKCIDPSFYESLKKGKINHRDILIVKDGATTGKISFVDSNFPYEKAAVNEHIFLLRIDKNKACPEYIFHFLKTKAGQSQILKDFHGAAIGGITRKFIETALIPLPPTYNEQVHIANLLSKLEGLIATRKKSIEQLDELLKSVFLDMFGDPVKNEKGWEMEPLDNFITHLTSGGRGWAKYYTQKGKRFIRSLDVQMNRIGEDDIVYVDPPANKESERTRVCPGDVLLTITGSKIGRVSMVPENFEEAYISQHVSIIRTERITPLYLSFYLSMPNCGQIMIKKAQYGQAKPGLNLKQIRDFQVLIPPQKLQEHYATIVEKTEGLRSLILGNLKELHDFHNSLTKKAFSGKLDLSEIPLPETDIAETDIAETVQSEKEEEQMMSSRVKLPAPDDMSVLKTAKGRKTVVKTWFHTWLEQIDDSPFTTQEFVDSVQHRLYELLEDDVLDWGVDEYDELKKWIFKALENGSLIQGYDDANNRVQVIVQKEDN